MACAMLYMYWMGMPIRCSCPSCSCTDSCDGVAKLGELERQVMNLFWEEPGRELSGREVADLLPEYAYTTVATILDRLKQRVWCAAGPTGARTSSLRRAPARPTLPCSCARRSGRQTTAGQPSRDSPKRCRFPRQRFCDELSKNWPEPVGLAGRVESKVPAAGCLPLNSHSPRAAARSSLSRRTCRSLGSELARAGPEAFRLLGTFLTKCLDPCK
jgi:Penicillinase repressor